MKLHVDNYTRVMLTIIAVLLTVVAAGLWFETPTTVSTAQAKLPDSGLQFNQIIQGLGKVEQSIAEMSNFLRTGTLRVDIVEDAKNPSANNSVPARRGP